MSLVSKRPRLSLWLKRAAAIVIGLVALALIGLEGAGIVDGLLRQRDGGTVELEVIVVVQGIIGLPALLAAMLCCFRAFAVAIDPPRSLTAAVLGLVIALPLGVLYIFASATAYGS